jgi:2-dehydro-3-deoxyphosphogluconate aldolase / (4S)-4-hydroxy-2-oxoglutarate aldolase
MTRDKVMDIIKKTGVIAVLRAGSADECEKLAEAAVQGGIQAIEITMTVPGAADVIARLSGKYSDNGAAVIGAGTVLDPETARLCILAGASFIVSPALNIETIRLCNRYVIAVVPGIMTVTEAVTALEYGCSVLKLFPSNAYGPAIIKSFQGPLPQAGFIPTGGVSLKNADEWIRAGAAAIGTGSDLTNCGGDYSIVTKNAQAFMKAVANARI